MGCCSKGKTHRRHPKKREGMWKDLDLALAEADSVEIGLTQALTKLELRRGLRRKPRGTPRVPGTGRFSKAAGCPEGQHKHAPYDYCHPSDRKHRGYTDEKPSGELDAAHGVLDTALADARGMGAQPIVNFLQNVKAEMAGMKPPEAKAFLKEQALKFEKAEQRLKGSRKPRIRALAAAHKFVKQKLRQAAMRLQPSTPAEERERAGKADADIRGMSDEELEGGLARLKRFLSTKGGELSVEAYEMFNDRSAAMQREARVRGLKGYGFGRGGPGPGQL